jgi:hypothetical protein
MIDGGRYTAIGTSHWYGRVLFRLDPFLDLCNTFHIYEAAKRKIKVIIEVCN